MKTPLLAALALLSVITLTGCTTAPVRLPASAKLRDHLGHVAVVAKINVPRIRYQVPDSKSDVAAEKHSFELITPKMIISSSPRVGGPPEALVMGAVALSAPLVLMSGAPVAQEVRRVYGLIAADIAETIARSRATLDTAVAPIRFEQQLRDQVIAELRRNASRATLAHSPREADTLVELFVYEPTVSGSEGINPGMSLSLGVRIRLVDARSGRELYYDYLDYQSAKHRFVTWAANDARLLHEEIDRSLTHLSGEIVAQLFTRSSDQSVEPEALAARGIERRPPDREAAAPAWMMPQPNRAVARR